MLPNEQVALAMEHCDTSLGQVLETRFDENEGPLESKRILKVYDFSNQISSIKI